MSAFICGKPHIDYILAAARTMTKIPFLIASGRCGQA